MRRLRLLLLGTLSFIVMLGADYFGAVVSVALCGSLSFCSLTGNGSWVAIANTPNASSAETPRLSGQELAIPPIIRDAPIDLQGSLADDFIVSRQTPYSSGRNEVLIISPSTGTEQRFEISLPTGDSFQLYEAKFSKVKIDNPSKIVESSDLIKVQEILESFSISFDSNNEASNVTLADGSRAEFSKAEAVIYDADGQVVETIPLLSSKLSDSISASSTKSLYLAKPAPRVLAQATGCESGIRNQLYMSSQDIGRKSNALRNTLSMQGKAASWVSAFGKQALEDSLVSATRNQTLQEIACVPPVECDERQDYEGASEIRTDLFKIPGSAGQQVDIRYEFYDIPDRMEIYYQGNLVDSIPRGGGQTSGSSQLSVNLPGGTNFVGVKLIGNEDKGTRWNYTISCSIECDQINADEEIAERERRTESANAEWSYIKDVIGKYYEENSNNPAAAAFSKQMYNLAIDSFANRAEINGWAGDFTRNTLLVAAKDIDENRAFWNSPPPLAEESHTVATKVCDGIASIDVGIDPLNNSQRAYDCGFGRAGEHHVNRHLKPAFAQSIQSRLSEILENDCLNEMDGVQEMESTMEKIRQEHSKLLKLVLVPRLSTLPISWAARNIGAASIPSRANDLREESLNNVLEKYVREGRISLESADMVKE